MNVHASAQINTRTARPHILSAAVLMLFSVLIFSCVQEEKKVPSVMAPPPTKVMPPFRYHKLIEVKPGLDFDIVSWGRGADSVGSLLILKSDSAKAQFTTTPYDLEGKIVEVYNTDMNVNGNPEIIILTETKVSDPETSPFDLLVFEYAQRGQPNRITAPRLSVSQRKGYRGGDRFFLQQGVLMREFPIYEGKGDSAKKTSEKRLLEYSLRGSLSISEVKPKE
ncbi:MAG: hypothetical protein INR69_09045 [Mucilaginibacter polytrichastri]|nr:hypothetical protein [Mucilaginibacter polytrichastri]